MRPVFLAASLLLAAPFAAHAADPVTSGPQPPATTANGPAGATEPAPHVVAGNGAPAHQPTAELPHVKWSFDGPFGTYDRASLQRGFLVYKNVCANCHGMHLMSYRNLTGIGLSDEQVKAIAASVQVATIGDDGQPAERAGLPSDRFKSPYANELAARAANGGALPPDQSLIVKAREHGPDYIHALLNGYKDAPAGMTVPTGQYYNEYFPGHLLAMPAPLQEDQVAYTDGTKATVEQMSKDVTYFLTWASNPEMEQRKRMGVKVVIFLALMTGLTYAVKRRIWKDVH